MYQPGVHIAQKTKQINGEWINANTSSQKPGNSGDYSSKCDSSEQNASDALMIGWRLINELAHIMELPYYIKS